MSVQAQSSGSLERDWWLRLGLVFQSPRAVFAWLRDDTDAAAHARQEPVLLVGFLAGLAGVLSSNGIGHALDDFGLDGVDLAVTSSSPRSSTGSSASSRWARSSTSGSSSPAGSARTGAPATCSRSPARRSRSRSRSGRFGSRSTGRTTSARAAADSGTGGSVFEGIEVAVVVWCLALLVLGIRTVNGWTWKRALAATAVPALVPLGAFARAYGLI